MKKSFILFAVLLIMVATGCSGSDRTVPTTEPPSSKKAITAFSFTSPAATGVITEASHTIAITVPFGTVVTALVPTIIHTGSSISPATGVANNFTSPVTYTVTAADATKQPYTITVTVAAPLASLPKTGQTLCYNSDGYVRDCSTNTGQDGYLQKGVTWPSPRFTDNGDLTITDKLTGLMWTKNGNAPGPVACTPGVAKTWQGALDYVTCLNANNYLSHSDWRLPNRIELLSPINYGPPNPATWLIEQGFSDVYYYYWSSTTYAPDAKYAWQVVMYSGQVSFSYKDGINGNVWPVRTGQLGTVNLPKTGHTVCYNNTAVIACTNTGQDGDLQKGVTWPSPRFADHGDLTITDNLTGLMWTKDGNAPGPVACSPGVTKIWQEALDYVACLNANNYLLHSDWRLPNVNEMESVVHSGQSHPDTWLIAQGFSNVQANSYVSSSTYLRNEVNAWNVWMEDGGFFGDDKDSSHYYVWPVRAGQ